MKIYICVKIVDLIIPLTPLVPQTNIFLFDTTDQPYRYTSAHILFAQLVV